jgi:hypothetical protein
MINMDSFGRAKHLVRARLIMVKSIAMPSNQIESTRCRSDSAMLKVGFLPVSYQMS